MSTNLYEIESSTLFSKSKIWQLNRDFYEYSGMEAFSEDLVPYHLTSSAFVGKTYAELIFALLIDLAQKGKIEPTVYIVELGAGHGRLAFHILKQLDKLILGSSHKLPPYCYVLSDIIEENLDFFKAHPQFESYYQRGVLDLAFFDGLQSEAIELRYSKKTVGTNDLEQPVVAIANYFFDSIPNDLFLFRNGEVSNCSIAIKSKVDPGKTSPETLIDNLELEFSHESVQKPVYENALLNDILEVYKKSLTDSYVFFPTSGIRCLDGLKSFSKEGLFLLSMDKGFHDVRELKRKKQPEFITHGSFSIWVNYHALGSYCSGLGGKALLPAYSTFHLELAAMLFLNESDTYKQVISAYERVVNDFGPDDFNTLKHLAYNNVSRLSLRDLLALLRLSGYDSTFFKTLLPRLKQVAKTISFNERKRIGETLQKVWSTYYSMGEPFDLAYELGGIAYDLGFYPEALDFFEKSEGLHGGKADTFYNKALCYYQLRQDGLFYGTMSEGKATFPAFELYDKLEELEMG